MRAGGAWPPGCSKAAANALGPPLSQGRPRERDPKDGQPCIPIAFGSRGTPLPCVVVTHSVAHPRNRLSPHSRSHAALTPRTPHTTTRLHGHTVTRLQVCRDARRYVRRPCADLRPFQHRPLRPRQGVQRGRPVGGADQRDDGHSEGGQSALYRHQPRLPHHHLLRGQGMTHTHTHTHTLQILQVLWNYPQSRIQRCYHAHGHRYGC